MNDTTRCHPRTLREAFGLSPDDAVAIHKYKTPAHRRFFFAFARWGWLWIFLAVLLLTGCGEMADKEADAANLRDALAQAQQDRPDAAARYIGYVQEVLGEMKEQEPSP